MEGGEGGKLFFSLRRKLRIRTARAGPVFKEKEVCNGPLQANLEVCEQGAPREGKKSGRRFVTSERGIFRGKRSGYVEGEGLSWYGRSLGSR